MWRLLGAFLLNIAGSLAGKVLFSLGFGFVSYQAIIPLVNDLEQHVRNNYQAMAAIPLALLNMAGVGQAIGILLSALVVRASMMAIKQLLPR